MHGSTSLHRGSVNNLLVRTFSVYAYMHAWNNLLRDSCVPGCLVVCNTPMLRDRSICKPCRFWTG
jgi:hypothetical protein